MEADTYELAASALDDVDRAIIRAYWLNPKAGNAGVGRQLRVSEATVRRRLRALVESDILQFSVVLGPSVTAGYIEFQLGVSVAGHLAEAVAEEIVAMPKARYVALTAGGPFDIFVAASVPSMDELLEFKAAVATISGVQGTVVYPILKVLKRSTDAHVPEDWGVGGSEPDGSVPAGDVLEPASR